MREILFRGKRKDSDWWEHGDYSRYFTSDRIWRSFINGFEYEVYPETVGQYTGLVDIGGKKIFESDIMKTAVSGITQHVGVVEFSDGAFGLRCTDGSAFFLCFVAGSYQVIGNIHDNPEFITKER